MGKGQVNYAGTVYHSPSVTVVIVVSGDTGRQTAGDEEEEDEEEHVEVEHVGGDFKG